MDPFGSKAYLEKKVIDLLSVLICIEFRKCFYLRLLFHDHSGLAYLDLSGVIHHTDFVNRAVLGYLELDVLGKNITRGSCCFVQSVGLACGQLCLDKMLFSSCHPCFNNLAVLVDDLHCCSYELIGNGRLIIFVFAYDCSLAEFDLCGVIDHDNSRDTVLVNSHSINAVNSYVVELIDAERNIGSNDISLGSSDLMQSVSACGELCYIVFCAVRDPLFKNAAVCGDKLHLCA